MKGGKISIMASKEPKIHPLTEKDQVEILKRGFVKMRAVIDTVEQELKSKVYSCQRCHKRIVNKKLMEHHIAKCME